MTRTVLVVDDSETVRKLLRWILAPLSLRVLEAADGVLALEAMGREDVDLVVADLNMPVMDGLELVRSIRALPSRGNTPVLMLTTEPRERDIQAALKAGVNQYLQKPSTPAVIREKVLALLGETGS